MFISCLSVPGTVCTKNWRVERNKQHEKDSFQQKILSSLRVTSIVMIDTVITYDTVPFSRER
jgi:hypothetical protein